MIGAFNSDPLAKEVPLFALVATNIERERLIDEGLLRPCFWPRPIPHCSPVIWAPR
jgi:hypothetical protein